MSVNYPDGFLPWLINDYTAESAAAPTGTPNLPDLFPMKLQDICKIYWLAKHATFHMSMSFINADSGISGNAGGTADVSFDTPSARRTGGYGTYFSPPIIGINDTTIDKGPQYMFNVIPNPDYNPDDPDSPPTIIGDPTYIPNGNELIIAGMQWHLSSPEGGSSTSDPPDGRDVGFAAVNPGFGIWPNRVYGGYTSYDKTSGLYYVRAHMLTGDQDNTCGPDIAGGYFPLLPSCGIAVSTFPWVSGLTPITPTLDVKIDGTTVGSAPLYSNDGSAVTGTFTLNFDDFLTDPD